MSCECGGVSYTRDLPNEARTQRFQLGPAYEAVSGNKREKAQRQEGGTDIRALRCAGASEAPGGVGLCCAGKAAPLRGGFV